MKICGIIAEYNPFHNGHLYQIQEAKRITGADEIVVIMSGHFVQRGEPAVIDKWTRTKIALDNGVDCVFELPVYFSTASAQDFAKGSVALLEKLGVDDLCFGSEYANSDVLTQIATYLHTEEYREELLAMISRGYSYSKAMSEAIKIKFGDLILKSNDFLGISYLSEIIQNDYRMIPHCIKRVSNDYNDEKLSGSQPNPTLSKNQGFIASATAIRKLMQRRSLNIDLLSQYLPENAIESLSDYPLFVNLEMFHKIFNAIFIREGAQELSNIRGMREGIENRIFERLTLNQDLEHMIEEVTSRRYSKNSISRLIVNTLIGIHEIAEPEKNMDYIRVLGFRENSRSLKTLKSKSDLFFLSNMARDLKKYQRKNPLIDLDLKASRLYDLINPIFGLHSEFTKKIIINS